MINRRQEHETQQKPPRPGLLQPRAGGVLLSDQAGILIFSETWCWDVGGPCCFCALAGAPWLRLPQAVSVFQESPPKLSSHFLSYFLLLQIAAEVEGGWRWNRIFWAENQICIQRSAGRFNPRYSELMEKTTFIAPDMQGVCSTAQRQSESTKLLQPELI